jgi:hypothetical protein
MNASIAIPASDILAEAYALTTGPRQDKYAPPNEDFRRTAGALTALGYRGPRGDMQPHDVAVMVICVKLSRIQHSPEEKDHWRDTAGYSRCGWLCVGGAE